MPGTSPRSALIQLADELSPQQARMLRLLLRTTPVSTVTVRQDCAIGNPSGIAIDLTAHLAAMGWQVRCELRGCTNRFGQFCRLGWWHLEPLAENLEPGAPARRQREGVSA